MGEITRKTNTFLKVVSICGFGHRNEIGNLGNEMRKFSLSPNPILVPVGKQNNQTVYANVDIFQSSEVKINHCN